MVFRDNCSRLEAVKQTILQLVEARDSVARENLTLRRCKQRVEELEAENTRLRAELARLGHTDNNNNTGGRDTEVQTCAVVSYHCIINHLRWYVVYQLYQCVYRSIYTDREDVNHSGVAPI